MSVVVWGNAVAASIDVIVLGLAVLNVFAFVIHIVEEVRR